MRNLSRGQAEGTLKAIKKQFYSYVVEDRGMAPKLVEHWDGHRWVIIWEDGAPYDWTMLAAMGGVDEEFGFVIDEIKLPKNVFVEPVNGSVLALYPA